MANNNDLNRLEIVLKGLIKSGYNAKDLDGSLKEAYNEFLGEYAEFPNMIKIDCKVDMAIPKEDLEKNLQLLIDRHGVQEVSSLIEKVLENGFNNALKLL